MPIQKAPPLSLYIHIPWCLKKCPYCDFNSHAQKEGLPEDDYVNALIHDLEQHLPEIWGRPIASIFIGGGTPSLFQAESINKLLMRIRALTPFLHPNIEITLEANPGTFEQQRFKGFRQAGINRLSIGVQSFQQDKLEKLGRVHSSNEALSAIDGAKIAGFERINIDLMHGLPGQELSDALYDLDIAINCNTSHLSWYQLTLEPNTVFAKYPPTLPQEETLWEIQEHGQTLLAENGFQQYETSAYCRNDDVCLHNMNYWQFGDYLGIGAGAHSKITDVNTQCVTRFQKKRSPKDYMKDTNAIQTKILSQHDLILEFMMNALRLHDGVALTTFAAYTGLNRKNLQPALQKAIEQGFIDNSYSLIKPTKTGRLFLNECLQLFM